MLVSLADMKIYLEETSTDYDDFLTERLNLYTSAINNYCGRVFEAGDYTQDFYRTDFVSNSDMFLYHYPINNIATIKTVETLLGVDTKTTLETYEYRTNIKLGKVLRLDEGISRYWFSDLGINSRVEIIYNAGFVIVPLEIQSVVKSITEEDYNKKVSGVAMNFGKETQRVSIPGVISLDFDYSLQPNERNVKFGMLLGNYVNVLDSFRSERPLVGEIKENYVS